MIKTEKDTECEIEVYGNSKISYITPDGESAAKDAYIPVYIEKQSIDTILYGIKLTDAYVLEITFDGIRIVEDSFLNLDACNQALSDIGNNKTPDEFASLMETYKPECVHFTFVDSYSKGSSSDETMEAKVCGEHDENYICLEPNNYQENITTLTSAGCTLSGSDSNKFSCSDVIFSLDDSYVAARGMNVETGEYSLCSVQYDSVDGGYNLSCAYK